MTTPEEAEILRKTKKHSRIRSFNRLLGVMNHQRILVMAIAVSQTALAHFILFLVCLGLLHAKEIANLLLADRLDQKEREEYYEMPRIHGVSTNDIRFLEADKIVTCTLVIMYISTALAAVYALCTLGLLIGTLKRRCELMVPWMFLHSIVCILTAIGLIVAYLYGDDYFVEDGDEYSFWLFGLTVFFTNIFLWYVVRSYYESLKMMKRLTEEVVLPIPFPAAPFHFRKENMYIGDGGYKHLLSDTNPNYVV